MTRTGLTLGVIVATVISGCLSPDPGCGDPPCGGHGQCDLSGAAPECVCSPGYVDDGTNTCAIDLRACVYGASCPTGLIGWNSINNLCTGYVYDALLADREKGENAAVWEAFNLCENLARNCDEFISCRTFSPEERSVCESLQDMSSYCLEGSLLMCPGPDYQWPEDDPVPAVKWNCTDAGLECNEGPTNGWSCGTGSCDSESFESTCEGNLLKICSSAGQIQTFECSDYLFYTYDPETGPLMVASNICGKMADGEPGCIGDGEPCDEVSFSNHCEGYDLVSCTGGKIGRVDCRNIIPGTTCSENGDYGLECVPEAPECDSRMENLCEDGIITFCAYGEVVSVDCLELGFAGCTLLESISGQSHAMCRQDR